MANELTFREQVLISAWIGGRKKRYTRLFSASEQGCSAATFHQNCNNKGPTLTVVFHSNGNVYGGYARVSWMPGSGESVYDADAFLFVLERGTMQNAGKFSVRIPENALMMNTTCGPVFGNGPDLMVFKDTITKGTTGLPLNSAMTPESYQWSQETATALTNGTFEALDVQVYAVEGINEL